MYERSQDATGLPDPRYVPRHELGERLYARHAIERYVALIDGRVVGHGLTEPPNPQHEDAWRAKLSSKEDQLIELGGAFVEPSFARAGIWSALLLHRVEAVRKKNAIPVSATWSTNKHVRDRFELCGGVYASRQVVGAGEVDLFVFP